MKYLDELNRLNLPIDKYAIFGSGVLAIRGIRENKDLDIIVKWELWDELIFKYEVKDDEIEIGNLHIVRNLFPDVGHVDSLIYESEVINGIHYVKLEKLLQWKKIKRRDKDLEDIKLIENYLNQHNN